MARVGLEQQAGELFGLYGGRFPIGVDLSLISYGDLRVLDALMREIRVDCLDNDTRETFVERWLEFCTAYTGFKFIQRLIVVNGFEVTLLQITRD